MRLTTSWHVMHISSPLRRRMVLLIYKDWTKLNTVRPAEVWCAEWGRKWGTWTDWTLMMNTLCKVPHSCCSQNTKHRKQRMEAKTQDESHKQELVYQLIRKFKMYMLRGLSTLDDSIICQAVDWNALISVSWRAWHFFLKVKQENSHSSWSKNVQKFTESKTLLWQSFLLIILGNTSEEVQIAEISFIYRSKRDCPPWKNRVGHKHIKQPMFVFWCLL